MKKKKTVTAAVILLLMFVVGGAIAYFTDTDTKTNTDTDTTTNTDTTARGGGEGDDDSFNIWKKLTPEDVDTIYESYPNSGGDLIQTVYEDVKKKRKKVGKAVPYILGFADRVSWDDSAEHGGGA